jgi:hypothetical protein
MLTVGVDPGVDGAAVALRWDGPFAVPVHVARFANHYHPRPRARAHERQAEMVRAVADVFRAVRATLGEIPGPRIVAVEAAAGRPGQAQIAQGANAGIAAALAFGLDADRYEVIDPAAWTRHLGLHGEPGARKTTLTALRLSWLRSRHPRVADFVGDHDGLVDAACIALYAREMPV